MSPDIVSPRYSVTQRLVPAQFFLSKTILTSDIMSPDIMSPRYNVTDPRRLQRHTNPHGSLQNNRLQRLPLQPSVTSQLHAECAPHSLYTSTPTNLSSLFTLTVGTCSGFPRSLFPIARAFVISRM